MSDQELQVLRYVLRLHYNCSKDWCLKRIFNIGSKKRYKEYIDRVFQQFLKSKQ